MSRGVYLDYAATTPIDPKVAAAMLGYMGPDGIFGNPASRTHHFGRQAEAAVETAREQLALLINAAPDEIVWTSGATEADNLAIKGVALSRRDEGNHIVTSAVEHRAVIDSCRFLQNQGFEVTYIKPTSDGLITPDQVEAAIRSDTTLVSLMHVNNEIGSITDVTAIAEITRDKDVSFHIDAAQSAARLPIDMKSMAADFVSLSGHKMYGPKGVGALYVRRSSRTRIQPQMHGGGHEGGMRSGTLPTHQIIGMGEAARLAQENNATETARVRNLEGCLLSHLMQVQEVLVNGNRSHCVPGIVSVRFPFVESESLMMMLDDIAVSTGSACTSASLEPSHVLTALGLAEDDAHCALRVSLGRFTTREEVDYAARRIAESVNELRSISSLWEDHAARGENRKEQEIFGESGA